MPMLRSMNPRWRMARFTAALALSAPRSLTLSLPFWSLDVVDVLIPHADRLASLSIRPISDMGTTQRLLEQDIPRLRDLVVLCSPYWISPPLILYFNQYPNIRSLQLGITLYYFLVAPCASLHHLELKCCTLWAWPETGHISSMHSVHDALELFPNLETLSLTYSLSGADWSDDIPELLKTVHLPRLRRLEIQDVPTLIPRFLSHLVFPLSTSLVFQLNLPLLFEGPLSAPVFPGINPSPSPGAEISLHIDFLHWVDPSQVHPQGLARWETHGEGVRPVRVTFVGAARNLRPIAHLTCELAHALAPPPGRGVTALTVTGSWARSPGDRHPQAHLLLLGAREYWAAFLPDLAELRALACTGLGATKDFIYVLGRPLPQSGEFPCPCLAEVTLVWHLSPAASEWFEVEWEWLNRVGGNIDNAELGPGDAPNGSQGVEDEVPVGGASTIHAASLSSEVTASLSELCDALGACLAERAGRCEMIRKLSIALRGWCDEDLHVQRWQAVLVERLLRDGLGHLVGEVTAVDVGEVE